MIEVPTSTPALRPQGAPFYIEQIPFTFGEQLDYATVDLEEDKVYNWPMVYILAGNQKAYVGQTTSVISRMGQHATNEEKRDFTTVNIIFNEEFNTSVITDYENRLIGYLHADGRYELTNKNEGMADTNYFSKAEYSAMFTELWEDLRQLDLVEHTIEEVEESEVFKYSPFKSLTIDQRAALDQIMRAIRKAAGITDDESTNKEIQPVQLSDQCDPILVSGMPGTGKTVLAIYLLKLLKDDPRFSNLNIRLFEPVTSLRKTLKASVKHVNGLTEADIIGPADLTKSSFGFTSSDEKAFDIILVDEAHKLRRRKNLGTQFGNHDKTCKKLGLDKEATQFDWVLEQTRLPIFFYDPLQSIGPSCVDLHQFSSLLEHTSQPKIELTSQMRVSGGKDYLTYINDILNGKQESLVTFPRYEFVLHDTLDDFYDSFQRTRSIHELTRMIAGYAWKWESKSDKNAFDIEYDGTKLRWNSTQDNWVGKGVKDEAIANEVGCIHTIQGYDLSYAYVIIGDDLDFDPQAGQFNAIRSNYFDVAGKNTATSDELLQYLKNIYYVLLTRGIYGTHVYVTNPRVRRYLEQFIPLAK